MKLSYVVQIMHRHTDKHTKMYLGQEILFRSELQKCALIVIAAALDILCSGQLICGHQSHTATRASLGCSRAVCSSATYFCAWKRRR